MVKAAVGTRAAWVADPDGAVLVAAASDADAGRMVHMLEAVGFRNVRGFLAGGIAAWQDAGLAIESTPAIDLPTLAERIKSNEVVLLDVREDEEWQAGRVAGSLHVPYHELKDGVPDEVRSVADGKPLAVACSAGNRSSIAASLLKRHGVRDLEHVVEGGVQDLKEHGIELEGGTK